MRADGVYLNLGCGARHLPKPFINVDLAANWCDTPPDLSHDISKPLPFDEGAVDEVHGYHIFEHFYRYETDAILDDWVRVLKPGGKLVLEMPCLDKIFNLIRHCLDTQQEMPDNLTMWGLYGDPNYYDPSMCHRWCYSVAELGSMFADRGLKWTTEKPQTHQPLRDMRMVGIK